MAVLNTGLAKVSGADFTLDQSLRFNHTDDAYLQRTPASAGNKRTWTFSCWVKRGNLDYSSYYLLNAYGSESERGAIRFVAGDVLETSLGGASNYHFTTTAAYRDPSAWYHIVWVSDTTNGTAADRHKLYVNGERVTSFSDEAQPTQNYEGTINSTNTHDLGNRDESSDQHFDGLMAEVHLIDGTALTPSSFGETGDYGEWKPIEVSGLTYGTNGFYLSFAGGGVMSATGGDSTDTDGDYKAASFTQDGTFTPSADGMVEYLVIAGGGGGGHTYYGGGGGAGGYRTGYLAVTESTAYAITVGDGGVQHTQGDNSSIASEVVSTGGGAGGNTTDSTGEAGGTGGSGGGGGNASGAGGSGTTGQGNDGGTAPAANYSAGGGGAGTAGSDNVGGNGLASSITGSSVTRAGGGGGGYHVGYGSGGTGGSGGGGQGGEKNDLVESGNGTPNTGSGGGGSGASDEDAGSGGSGIVIIRYKFQ